MQLILINAPITFMDSCQIELIRTLVEFIEDRHEAEIHNSEGVCMEIAHFMNTHCQ